MTRASDHARAHVFIEVAREPLDRESHARNGELKAKRRIGPPRPEREEHVAAAADRFVVVVSSIKLVDRVAPPIPLELLSFGAAATLARIGNALLRDAPRTPDGGVLADYTGAIEDAAALAAWLSSTAGVVAHGLFPPELVSDVLVGRGGTVERIAGARR